MMKMDVAMQSSEPASLPTKSSDALTIDLEVTTASTYFDATDAKVAHLGSDISATSQNLTMEIDEPAQDFMDPPNLDQTIDGLDPNLLRFESKTVGHVTPHQAWEQYCASVRSLSFSLDRTVPVDPRTDASIPSARRLPVWQATEHEAHHPLHCVRLHKGQDLASSHSTQ